jgi:hypothetical protein
MGDKNHWAKVPRQVVLHRMATAECLDSRLFWAMILWSWCGPEISDAVVLKDNKGFIRRDGDDKPIPATLKDLRELLGLAPNAKGHVSEAAARLVTCGAVRLGEAILHRRGGPRVMYPIRDPTTNGQQEKVPDTGNLSDGWYVAGIVVSTGNLPADPAARQTAVLWLEDLNTRWNSALKKLRTEYREEAIQGFSAHGILIGKKQKSREAKSVSKFEGEAPTHPPTYPSDSADQEDTGTAAARALDPEIEALQEMLNDEVYPVTGEPFTAEDAIEIWRLKGAGGAEQLQKRIRWKKRQGKLTHNGLVKRLAEDCAARPYKSKLDRLIEEEEVRRR